MTRPRVGEPGPRGPGHWPCGGRESARLRCLPLDTALRREGVRTPALSPPGHWPCGGRESACLCCLPLDTALRREGVCTPALSPPITLSITLSGTEMTALGPERTR